MDKKVTIITSVYRGAEFIEGFLEDILEQTAFDDCQLYMIEGNSPDNELEIVKPYMEKYDNIHYEKLDEDPGIYACWNLAIKATSSEYITNANLDDRLLPESIEKHIELLDNFPEYDVAYCYNATVRRPHQTWKDFEADLIFGTAPFSPESMLQANLPHNHPVWRRSLHKRCGYFEEEKYVSASDYDFWLRCTCEGCRFCLIPQILGLYYRNPEGMSTKELNMPRNLQEVADIQKEYRSHDFFKTLGNAHATNNGYQW